MSKKPKVSLIGGGNIGGTLTHILAYQGCFDVVLLDRTPNTAKGKALDIAQSLAIAGKTGKIEGTGRYEDIADSAVIIVTAGVARKPGMSRDDLLSINRGVMQEVGENIAKYAPEALTIVVTNPLDAMVYALQKYSGLPSNRVVGMAGVLDSGRFCHFLAQALGVATSDIQTLVLGGHGDSMVPLVGHTSVAGVPLKQLIEQGLISEEAVQKIVQRTRDGGAEIVQLLQNSSAYYAPAHSAMAMLNSYIFDQKRLLPCAAYLQGEYGISGLYVGVPAIIGRGGVEKVVELKLTPEEQAMFTESTAGVRLLVESMGL